MFPTLVLLLASVAFAQQNDVIASNGTAPETWVAGVFAILTGFLFCFFGTSMWRLTIFAAGFYSFGVLSVTVAVNVLDAMAAEKSSKVLLIVFVVTGVIGGLLATCLYKLGVMLVGGLGGFLFAVWILSFSPHGFLDSGAARIIFIIVFATLGALVTLKFEKHVVIIGSAFAGAFVFMVGVDCFTKSGFREDVARIVSAIERKEAITEYTSGAIYGMLASTIVMAIAGTVVQYKRFSSFGGK